MRSCLHQLPSVDSMGLRLSVEKTEIAHIGDGYAQAIAISKEGTMVNITGPSTIATMTASDLLEADRGGAQPLIDDTAPVARCRPRQWRRSPSGRSASSRRPEASSPAQLTRGRPS